MSAAGGHERLDRRTAARVLLWAVATMGVSVGVASCASTETAAQVIVPLPPPPAAAAPPALRLAWLPLEGRRVSAELVELVNARLAKTELAGVTETFQAAVSMEMAQLAIECIEKTPECYTAVGRSVGADRLLWAESQKGARGALTVRVVLFDVGAGAVVQRAERVFPSAKAARAGASAVVDQALGLQATAAAPEAPR